MKLWNNYRKELKIASRGFYFYMEIITAVILLVAIVLFVPVDATHVTQEVIFTDAPRDILDTMLQNSFGESGQYVRVEDTRVKLSPADIVYYDEQTGEQFTASFDDKKTLELETWEYLSADSGVHEKTLYIAQSMDDLLRTARAEKWYSTVIHVGEDGAMQYRMLLFGAESDRYKSLISAVMTAGDTPALLGAMENQQTETLGEGNVLNNRQSFIPMAVVMMNGLMGMLVVIAYLIIDKSSGLMSAMALTPMRTRSYLLSKVLVVLTTSLLSSIVVAVPVMGLQPNYLLFIPTVALVSGLSCMIGLWLSSFFAEIKSAYGLILIALLLLMLPALSYVMPGFAPLWIKLLPTYPMLQAVKETLLPNPSVGYILLVCGGMAALSALFLWWSEIRYRKILGV